MVRNGTHCRTVQLQVKRHRRKQSELHGKYLKSERPNPEFEHDEGRGGARGGPGTGPAAGTGGEGNTLARGDDYERLAVQKDRTTAAGAGPMTPRSAKAPTPRAGGHGGAAAAAGAGAGAGALGGLLGRKKVCTCGSAASPSTLTHHPSVCPTSTPLSARGNLYGSRKMSPGHAKVYVTAKQGFTRVSMLLQKAGTDQPLLQTGDSSFTSAKSAESFASAKSRPQSTAGETASSSTPCISSQLNQPEVALCLKLI